MTTPLLAQVDAPSEELSTDGAAPAVEPAPAESAAGAAEGVSDPFSIVRERMQDDAFWVTFVTTEVLVVAVTVLGLWLLIGKALPQQSRPAPLWGGFDVLAAFLVFFGLQLLIGGAATVLVRYEIVEKNLALPMTALAMAVLVVPAIAIMNYLVRTQFHKGVDAIGLSADAIPRGFLYGMAAWLVTILGFFAVTLAAQVGMLAAGVEPKPQASIAAFIEAIADGNWLTIGSVALLAVVVAPLAEEFIFRGLLFRWLVEKYGVVSSAVLSGIAFGIVHGNLAGLLPLSLLGVVFALLYHRTGNLWSSICMHAIFNGAMLGFAVITTQRQ
ncbi:MAG: CPBP family intramembrane glutamic endopeptidase [Planctomycetota bacterium]